MADTTNLAREWFSWWLSLRSRLILNQHGVLRRAVHQLPLVFIASFAVVGILIGSAISLHGWETYLLWGSILTAMSLWVVLRRGELSWLIAALICLPLFAARQSAVIAKHSSATVHQILSTEPQPAIVRATIDRAIVLRRHPLANSPRRRDNSQWQTQFECSLQQARVGNQFKPLSGRLLAVVDGELDDRRPGDELEIYGLLSAFDGPTNPGERDLRDVYRRRSLHARIDVESKDQILLLSRRYSGISAVMSPIANFASISRELLLQHTTDSAGPLAIALVIGQREFVKPDTRDLLLVTGTVHLLSVSGMHLAIIVVLAKIVAFFFRMSRTTETIWILSVCVFYVAITGGRPPVMRAAFLVAALLFSMWLRRPMQPMNTLAFAGLLLLFYNPQNATAVGVQLSFLAVATLLLCGQRHRGESAAVEQARQQEERLRRLSDGSRSVIARWSRFLLGYVGQLAWFSACVTATSVPLVWHHFHVVSPVSVLTNVLLSPLLIFALGFGVCTVLSGIFSTPLGNVFGLLCSAVLWLMHYIIQIAASIPLGHFWLPSPPGFWIAVFYVVLVGSLLWGERIKWLRRFWILIWSVIAYVLATWSAPLQQGAIEATFVDVGHGTSVVLRFNDDDVWLYDCGRMANDQGSSRDIDATLWSLGVTHLNGIVLSHADSDHYNAMPGVLKRFSCDQIVTPPGMLAQDESGALDATRAAIQKHDVAVHETWAGQTVATSDRKLVVLHPPLAGVGGNDNANSIVLSIQNGGRVLLLPGDLEPPGTQVLINQPRPKPGGVLMAPHHGSLTMDAESVLQWARPSETAVSGSRRAGRVEVAKMLAVTGSGVHVTAKVGAIRVTINDNGQIDIRCWKNKPW